MCADELCGNFSMRRRGQFMIEVLDAQTFDLERLNPHMNTWHVDLGNARHDRLPPHVCGIQR